MPADSGAAGTAMSVAYRFDIPLEDASLHWLRMDGLAYAPFRPPAIGGAVTL